MKRFLLLVITVFGLKTATGAPIEKSMLDTFIKYASISSQSSNDSICTQGQRTMALVLKSDVESIIREQNAKNVECVLSEHNYLYVTIPSNVKSPCPSIGISCHLDVTPEAPGSSITPIIDALNGRTIVRTDGTTLLGADDKCGCTIAVHLIQKLLSDKKIKHGKVMFAFCPNEDVGRAADNIDSTIFSPEIIYDLDGEGGEAITKSNFTARGLAHKFIGHDAHPADAKADKLGDATAAAATFIASVPVEYRPENTEGLQGYIHPWGFEKSGGFDVIVRTRVRYFDKAEGEKFNNIINDALARVARDFPNVKTEVLQDVMQYENVAYTLHPQAQKLVENAAKKIGKKVVFTDERGGTTAAMFAAKGLKGGMCLFTGQHEVHSTREYADLKEMEETYLLMLEIIKQIPSI